MSAIKVLNGMDQKGFTLVEVLIALVILFSSVVSFSAGFKLYTDARIKHDLYQDVYSSVLSLRNLIDTKNLSEEGAGHGKLNQFDFTYEARPVESARNYVFSDDMGIIGNLGQFELTLYEIHLKLSKDTWSKDFSFYVTQYKSGISSKLKGF